MEVGQSRQEDAYNTVLIATRRPVLSSEVSSMTIETSCLHRFPSPGLLSVGFWDIPGRTRRTAGANSERSQLRYHVDRGWSSCQFHGV